MAETPGWERIDLFGGPSDGQRRVTRLPLPERLTVYGAVYSREAQSTTYVYVKG